MTVSTSGHQCPKYGCRENVPYSKLACKRHWYELPKALRDAVLRAYKGGMGIGTPEHTHAVNACISAMNRHR